METSWLLSFQLLTELESITINIVSLQGHVSCLSDLLTPLVLQASEPWISLQRNLEVHDTANTVQTQSCLSDAGESRGGQDSLWGTSGVFHRAKGFTFSPVCFTFCLQTKHRRGKYV